MQCSGAVVADSGSDQASVDFVMSRQGPPSPQLSSSGEWKESECKNYTLDGTDSCLLLGLN